MSLEGISILITGASGSFGNAAVPELIKRGARRVVIYSRDEKKQSDMARRITDPHGICRYFLGDVRDLSRLEMAFHDVDWVISAAALKRIEAVEYNPLEAVKTNVLGTANVIEAALRTKVRKVVGLSTDKAAGGAINLYGATKLTGERLLLSANTLAAGRCAFSVVAYGNIWGSRGSVVPTWQEYLARGERVPVTDPDCTRYFMTIDEAVNLVLSTFETMKGGELVVPQLPAYRVGDLAEAMGAKIRVTGLASWEKRHESLGDVTSDRARRMTMAELREALKSMPCSV